MNGVPKEAGAESQMCPTSRKGETLGYLVCSVQRSHFKELANESGPTFWESTGVCAFISLPSLVAEAASHSLA